MIALVQICTLAFADKKYEVKCHQQQGIKSFMFRYSNFVELENKTKIKHSD